MTPADKLIQSIQQVLDTGALALNTDKLAADYAQWCATVNKRLDQCERLLEGKAEHEALQLAETPPSLLDLCAALSFDKADQWRGLCRSKNLPVPEELNERAISRLNDLYAKGITSAHPLYRDYRRAVAERDDERALSIIRSIVRLNPSDTNARQEIQRLEGKVRDTTCQKLAQAVQGRETAAILAALEEVEASGWAGSVNSAVLSQARALRQERDRELAFERCCGLITVLDRLQDRQSWVEALGPIQEVEQLMARHGVTLGAEATATFDEVRTWARAEKAAADAEEQFQAALRHTAFLVEKAETNDGPGSPRDLKSLRDEQHALVNQWRHVESFTKAVPEELQTRVKRRLSVVQTEINRLTRQRRQLTTIGIVAAVMIAGVAAWVLFQWRWTNGQVADLEKLQEERRVTSTESLITGLRRDHAKAASQSRLALAIQKSEQWIGSEKLKLATFKEMLAKLEQHRQTGFKDAEIDTIAKDWQQTRDFAKELAPEFRNTGDKAFLEFENEFDAVVQTYRRETETKFQAELKQAEQISTSLDQTDVTAAVVRQNVKDLAAALDRLEKLASPSWMKLPASLTGRMAPLQARIKPYQEALTKLDQAEAALRQATTLEEFYAALETFDAEHLRQLPTVRAARKVGSVKLTPLEVERLLLMPNDAEGWAAFLKNPYPTGLPAEVMPAELSKWLSLRDDDNLRDIYRYQMPQTDEGFTVCYPKVHRRIVYTRGAWRQPGLDSLGLKFRAMAFVPADDSTRAEFADANFVCQCSRKQPLQDGQLAQLGDVTPESVLLKRIGLDGWINDAGDKFKRPLLPMLDELRAGEKINPLFKAYVHWRFLELVAIRSSEWGARWVPAIESDRAALHDLAIGELRSGDWMVPVRLQRWEAKLTEFYKRTQAVSYVKQARFFERLLAEAHIAGMKYAGYIGTDGLPVLTAAGSRSQRLWGLSDGELQLKLIWKSGAGEATPLSKPQVFSPLFYCGREPLEVLKAASEKVELDWKSGSVNNYLPPLFDGEDKP